MFMSLRWRWSTSRWPLHAGVSIEEFRSAPGGEQAERGFCFTVLGWLGIFCLGVDRPAKVRLGRDVSAFRARTFENTRRRFCCSDVGPRRSVRMEDAYGPSGDILFRG